MAGDEMKAVEADEEGGYEFTGLMPGTYRVYADSPLNQAAWIGAFFGEDKEGVPVVLAAGATRRGVDIQLTRAGVLTVRVADEWGEPLAGVGVRLRRANTGREEHAGRERRTDDRGLVRLFPLPAGRYIVCAEPVLGRMAGDARRTPVERLVGSCASDDGSGGQQAVTVSGPDATQVDVVLRRSPTYWISGRVVSASGSATGRQTFLVLHRPRARGMGAVSVQADSSGHFEWAGVAPGDYIISATSGAPHDPAAARFEAAYKPVRIVDAGIDDLTIALRRGISVRGRVVFESDPPPAVDARRGPPFQVSAHLADDLAWRSGATAFGSIAPDWTFEISGVFGRRYLAFANAPKGWFVKSASYGDADVTETAFEVKEGEAVLEIVMSTRGASIAGSVVEGIGNPAAGAIVVVFAADPARRLLGGISLLSGGGDGRFTAGPLRAGDYLVAALPRGTDPPTIDDVEYLDRLANEAERVTLHGEETIDLQLRVR
jgi:hypothetical protein